MGSGWRNVEHDVSELAEAVVRVDRAYQEIGDALAFVVGKSS